VPPLAVTEADPFVPPLQETGVPPQVAVKATAGWVTVNEQEAVQLWESVTVTEYTPAASPAIEVAVEPVLQE
jgi:hypothetical protein